MTTFSISYTFALYFHRVTKYKNIKRINIIRKSNIGRIDDTIRNIIE